MNFTIENMEFYLLILMRISGFVLTAPFFSYTAIPMRMKAAISIVLSIVIAFTVPVVELEYVGVIGYATLVLKESVVGMMLGFFANMCLYIVSFSGQIMDMEMALSMASMYNPLTNIQMTVSGNIYNYFIMLVMVVTNMHYYIVKAIADSFKYFNVGEAVFSLSLKEVVLDFVGNFFIIGFRIVLPVFCCMLLINVILGVLAKAAPQMNMFVVGLQIKVLVGIILLLILVQTLPMVADFIFEEMKEIITQIISALTPVS